MIKDTKNHSKLKDVVRKVIAFMTLGIDVSGLFTEMSMVKKIEKKIILFLFLLKEESRYFNHKGFPLYLGVFLDIFRN